MASFAGAAFGVLADARGRQRRRRRRIVGAASLALVLSPVLAYVAVGGTPGGAPAPVFDRVDLNYAWQLRLPAGAATDTFAVTAPADREYRVGIRAPAASALVMTTTIGPGAGWTLATRHDSDCSTIANRTRCLLPFAAGGNPGGTWKVVVRKISAPAAAVRIFFTFNRHVGDYSPS